MKANVEMAKELKRLDAEIEATLAEQAGAFQKYLRTAQDLRRALRQTVQISNEEWVERVSRATKQLRDDMCSIEVNAAGLTFVGLNAERVGLQNLEVQEPTTGETAPLTV